MVLTARRLWIGLSCAALVTLGLLLWTFRSRADDPATHPSAEDSHSASRPRAPAATSRARSTPVTSAAPTGAPALVDPRILKEGRLARAELTLDTYLESTQYPPYARPMSERPDLVRPHHVPTRQLPLARADQKPTSARITLHQDRYFLSGDEQATLSIQCETSAGPVPCEVLSASASVPPDMSHEGGPVAILFADQGRDGDQTAGDGALTARVQPARQGFAAYHGPIRVDLDLRVQSESGGASFDLEYTPTSPAKFTGEVRESLADGSLDLYVGMTITRPGRYVVRARVDDAEDRQFAYLSWNEEMGAGLQEARLRLFGKLIHDQGAKAPFRLRDIEGFRLEENTYPDREAIPTLEGDIHTTKPYKMSDFSQNTWESEDKSRRVDRLEKETEKAREAAESAD
jgi:hypothetical protein